MMRPNATGSAVQSMKLIVVAAQKDSGDATYLSDHSYYRRGDIFTNGAGLSSLGYRFHMSPLIIIIFVQDRE